MFPIGSAYLNYVQSDHSYSLHGQDTSGNQYTATFLVEKLPDTIFNGSNASAYQASLNATKNGAQYISTSETFYYQRNGDSLEIVGCDGPLTGSHPANTLYALPNDASVGSNGNVFDIRGPNFGFEAVWDVLSNLSGGPQTANFIQSFGLSGPYRWSVQYIVDQKTISLSSPSITLPGAYNVVFTLL